MIVNNFKNKLTVEKDEKKPDLSFSLEDVQN
jgi:NADH:ubiquinone oxidoreductase subunit E